MQFLTTTKIDQLPTDKQIIMLDGTVPKWEKKPGDLHFDHHRPGGSKIQMDEINSMFYEDIKDDAVIVTTQTDADACVAAAWILWGKYQPRYGYDPKALISDDNFRKLRAIAFDCDYLYIPEDLSDLADFAAQAVAAMKSTGNNLANQLGLPIKRNDWTDEQREEFYSAAFQNGTEWLIAAMKGECLWPGEQGEATEYWEQVEADIQMLADGRIDVYKGVAIAQLSDVTRYVDPRAFYRAIPQVANLNDLSPVTLVVQPRKERDGIRYTLGSNPAHPNADKLDYASKKVFEALTAAEVNKNPAFEGWGGRAAVGGSSWNNPSLLSVTEVVDIVLKKIG